MAHFCCALEPYEAAELLNRLQKESKLPLLFAADFERGVATRLIGTTNFPHAMAFGADGKLEDAEAFGRITAQEARAIGVHWNFFPDADVNSNPANPIINTRSFGEDPKQVGDLVTAYIKGAHAGGMLTTVKHFPGHGDTATDSHLGVASVSGTARISTPSNCRLSAGDRRGRRFRYGRACYGPGARFRPEPRGHDLNQCGLPICSKSSSDSRASL